MAVQCCVLPSNADAMATLRENTLSIRKAMQCSANPKQAKQSNVKQHNVKHKAAQSALQHNAMQYDEVQCKNALKKSRVLATNGTQFIKDWEPGRKTLETRSRDGKVLDGF